MQEVYKVSIYKSLTGRFCIRHPKGAIHHKDFASLSYAKEFCKQQGWEVAALQFTDTNGKKAFLL